MLVGIAVVMGGGYLYLQKSNLINEETNAGAYVGQTFPPILFFASKASPNQGCYDLSWSSLNVTSCTSSWRPTVITSGAETVCQGKKDVEGVRQISPKVGDIAYTITCAGSEGTVSRSIKIKSN